MRISAPRRARHSPREACIGRGGRAGKGWREDFECTIDFDDKSQSDLLRYAHNLEPLDVCYAGRGSRSARYQFFTKEEKV